MKVTRPVRLTILLGMVFSLFVSVAHAQQAAKKEYTFKGKVEKIDVTAKTITVNGEKVQGWMEAMTMMYSVDKPDVLKTIKVGDQITARVFEGDTKVLHDIKVVPAKSGTPAPTK